ncbi:fibronectin type III domain-containing protein, partial [bacterium]|nr:fibronectin type III domain-containing protein [bacterium]
MRRFFLITSLLLITLNISAFSWDPVPACQPMFLRVSHDTIDAARTMAITWNTKSECQTEVMVGESGFTQKSVKGTHFKGNEGLGYIHEVHLTDLDPETLYDYKAGDGTNWSPPFTFQTAPLPNSCSPVVFAVASD